MEGGTRRDCLFRFKAKIWIGGKTCELLVYYMEAVNPLRTII